MAGDVPLIRIVSMRLVDCATEDGEGVWLGEFIVEIAGLVRLSGCRLEQRGGELFIWSRRVRPRNRSIYFMSPGRAEIAAAALAAYLALGGRKAV